MLNNKLFFLLVMFCFGLHTDMSKAQVSESDSLELVNFYYATGGDNWDDNDGWLVEPVSEWLGITLTDDETQIYKINLDYNSLIGTIPNLNLPSLVELRLYNNQLIGNIPNFSNLPNLELLSLSFNGLTGTIPDFNNLVNLERILLFSNELTGTITDFSNLPNLRFLNISGNQLTGNLIDFSNLPTLETLYVDGNNLTGTVPDFQNISSLQSLDVRFNEFVGTIPNFSNLPNLILFLCCSNDFFGAIPDFENCPNLLVESINFTCVQQAKVKGTIFYDENQDCIFNENENTIPQGKILINGDGTYAFSNENGAYELSLNIGTYVISYLPPNQLWQQTCLDEVETYTITLNSYDDVIENINFANEIVEECALMNLNINTAVQRRCMTNTYTVQYCNEGTETAEDAYVEIYFEEEIVVLDASIPYTIDDDEIYTFELGDVGIGQCGSFTVTDSISCEAVLGSAVCAMAYVYPNNLCKEISEEWDGSDMEVSVECLEDVVRFYIANNGEEMEDSLTYRMYDDDVLSAVVKYKLNAAETLEVDYEADGTTYRLIAEQHPAHPSKEYSQAVVELCGVLPFSLGFVTSQTMANTESFFHTHCEEIIGSYDPNDKIVTPKGIGEEHFIEANTNLEYKIRFQNTGNDTAFQVILVDTLDVAHLDIATFETLNASHDYSLEIVDGEILRFTFDNILLVDSNANEPESHGFVSFKINQLPDNELGAVIANKAYIFFDYNQPIVTPLAFSTIWEAPKLIGTSIFEFENSQVKVYPNPAKDVFYIDFSATKQHFETAEIKIYDVFGRLVLAQKINVVETYFNVSISNLENGVYIYKTTGENDVLGSGKLVVQ